MNQNSRPISEILRSKDKVIEEEEEPKIRSREEWRKEKELEEARKSGTAPAAVDEEGRDINPHIPQYISAAPWYIEAQGPTLKHQRPQPKPATFASINDYYERGQKGQAATKYRKGACENCGAMTHKRKDCLDRPRKTGARYTNDSIAADERLLPDLKMDFDGKRDRWAGFDPSMYKSVVDEYAKVEEAKRHMKEEKMKEDHLQSEATNEEREEVDGDSDSDADAEDEKYAEHVNMPGTKVDSKQRITVRNLRIREDTAKYLRNLDIDSAYYDPKTRAMRDDPYKDANKTAPDMYGGENFVRFSGDTLKVGEVQSFAWQAHDRGVDVHLQAEPTKAELLHKEFKVKRGAIKENIKAGILEKYGGTEHMEPPPPELLFAQTENYVEYSRQGRITKGAEKVPIKSSYEEDVLIGNHTRVWGSFWAEGQWGFRCCHSFIKNSYCTGEAGKEAFGESDAGHVLLQEVNLNVSKSNGGGKEATSDGTERVGGHLVGNENESAKQKRPIAGPLVVSSEDDREESGHKLATVVEEPVSRPTEKSADKRKKNKKKKDKKRRKASKKRKQRREEGDSSEASSSSGDSGSEDDDDRKARKRLKVALKQERKRTLEETDERKRSYNSMYEVKAPTEEEVEAYHLSRRHEDDPMLAFMSKK